MVEIIASLDEKVQSKHFCKTEMIRTFEFYSNPRRIRNNSITALKIFRTGNIKQEPRALPRKLKGSSN